MDFSISSIGSYLGRNDLTFDVSPGRTRRVATSSNVAEPPSDTLELSDAYRLRESLRIRSRTKLKVSGDGEIEARTQTKLRYKYDFFSADGSRISVRLRANLNFKQSAQGDESSQSLKLSVKASVKAIQRDVSAVTTSLREAPEISAEIDETISRALELFEQLTDAATGEFAESDPLDGDQLIAGIVDAFNEFADAVSQSVVPEGEALAVSTNDRVPDAPENIAGDDAADTQPAGSIPQREQPVRLEALPKPLPVPDPVAVANDLDSPAELVSDNTRENGASVEKVETGSTVQPVAEDDGLQQVAGQTASAALFNLRFRIVQSLTTLTGTLDADSGHATFSQSVFKSSAELSIRAHGDAVSFDDALVPGLGFDFLG